MKDYQKHNDLVSNFFQLYQYFDIGVTYTEQKIINVQFSNVIYALKLKYCIDEPDFLDNIFKNDEFLLMSIFIFSNWREIIKKSIKQNLNYFSFRILKKKILSSLIEANIRTGSYSIVSGFFNRSDTENIVLTNIETFNYDRFIDDVANNNFKKINSYFNYSLNKKTIKILNKQKQNLTVEEIIYKQPLFKYKPNIIKYVDLFDEINWLENLSIEDVKNNKFILKDKFSGKNLIKPIIEIIKPVYKKEYNDQYNDEIKKFIYYITSVENNIVNFNLSFIKSTKQKMFFAKIFLFLRFKGIITQKKGIVNKILSDLLNISERTLENITNNNIKKELEQNESGIAYIINQIK